MEINIDFVEQSGVIHEIKKSRKVEDASIWQVKYYLYYLKRYGIENIRTKIDYPLLKQTVEISLEPKDIEKLMEILEGIKAIIQEKNIPVCLNNSICKKCAYFDLCMI